MNAGDRTQYLLGSVVELASDGINFAKALQYGFRRFKHTVNRRNLPARSHAERFDSIVLGEIATNCVIDYIRRVPKLCCCSYDELRVDNFENEDMGWDAIVFYKRGWYPDVIPNYTMPLPFKLSVKSSTIPEKDAGNLHKVIQTRDIKILKINERVEDDLRVDGVVQTYYPHETANRKDIDLLAVQSIIDNPALGLDQLNRLANLLRLEARCRGLKIVAFSLASEIVDHIESSEKKLDHMFVDGMKKEIWNTKIADVGHPMQDFDKLVRHSLHGMHSRCPTGS